MKRRTIPDKRNRAGTYVGAYIGEELKSALSAEAKREHRNVSEQLIHILCAHFENKRVANQRKSASQLLEEHQQ